MKILVVTPTVPFPPKGAENFDRLSGIKLLQDLGHSLTIMTRTFPGRTESVAEFTKYINCEVMTVPYTTKFDLSRLLNPLWIDGASFAYAQNDIQKKYTNLLQMVKPTFVWLDHTFLWPLISPAQRFGAKVIVRSANVESRHILEEGITPLNLVRAAAKGIGERVVARTADAVVAITPHEAEFYEYAGAVRIETVPLRNLPTLLSQKPITAKTKLKLDILFSGAVYTVAHNKNVARWIIEQLAPELERRHPERFVIHITGDKLPGVLAEKALKLRSVVYEGYVPNFDTFLEAMDIALAPSFSGAGMQQKIFEPMVRGIPTITTRRGLAGYDFKNGKEVLIAQTVDQFIEALELLLDTSTRATIGTEARIKSMQLFSQETIYSKIHSLLTL